MSQCIGAEVAGKGKIDNPQGVVSATGKIVIDLDEASTDNGYTQSRLKVGKGNRCMSMFAKRTRIGCANYSAKCQSDFGIYL